MAMTAQDLNRLTEGIIGAAIAVHRAIGPGLLESAYAACLDYELREAGFRVEREVALPVVYRGMELECGYRVDLLVEDAVIVELKAVSDLSALHEAQVLSYLKIGGLRVGLLLNFNVAAMKDGIRRIVNSFPPD